MKILSVIVPCFNEEQALPFFYEEIKKISVKMKDVSFEYLFIDDGSNDNTLSVIKKYSEMDEFVVIMDADLQDPPSLLPEMYEAIVHEGYDSVATRRMNRKGEPLIRSFFAKLFYKIMNHISDSKIVDGARDYRMMTRQMVDAILSMCEYNRF